MKVFWSLLLLVCLAGFAAIFWPVSKSPANASDDVATTTPQEAASTPAAQLNTSTTNKATPAVTPIASTPSTNAANNSVTGAANNSSASASAANPSPTAGAIKSVTPAANTADKTKSATVAISPDSLKDGLDYKLGNAIIVPGNILRQADGSILADNKYLISGAGTMEDPYRVTWECLTSASQTYIPRLQQNNIPQRVAMLDGKWIRIEGYMAFPLMLQESSEILAMLNQWDGCCIGVPPTPYDAIEVKLAVPVKPGRRHTYNFGTVTGKFKVDPYLVENWLVGLYQLESASLQSDM